jgi:23S rRNA (adenine2503-C2)-methyltransferase
MDVLSLTFEQVTEQLRPRRHEVKPLRALYRTLLCAGNGRVRRPGPLPARFDGALTADVLPVVRRVVEGDLTKFVQRTHDGLEIESVVVPMQRTHGVWRTLCVSSQVGCARGCVFCETGQLGLLRNLTPGEIVGQVVAAQRDCVAQRPSAVSQSTTPADREVGCCISSAAVSPPGATNPQPGAAGPWGGIRNVVFMGMGEPLDNYDHVIHAIRVLMDPSGLSFAGERVTISTVGRVAGIRKLAELGWRRLNLAVSLNAPNDDIRSRIMPHNRLEPMGALRAALLDYPLRNCQFFMMEYVLIPGVNNARAHAFEVADYLRPLKSMLNVIPYNPRLDSPWRAPAEEEVQQFLDWLTEAGQGCKRRITKGREHMAACGQLGNRALARRRRPQGTAGA